MEARVFHRLYTHAPKAPGTTGGHFVGLGDIDVEWHLPQPVVEAVNRLLVSLAPAGAEPAYAARRFATHGGSIVCFVVSYPDVVADGLDRAGALSHARAIQLSSEAAWLDLDALIDVAATISMDRVMEVNDSKLRLNAYVDQLENVAAVARWHPNAVQALDFDLLCEVAAAMTAAGPAVDGGSAVTSRIACTDSGQAVRLLAAAWCALPTALQIRCSWALDAEDDVTVKLHFVRGETPRTEIEPRVGDLMQRYLRLIVDGDLELPLLLSKRDVGSPDLLDSALRDLEGAATLSPPSSDGGGVASTIGDTPEVMPVAKKNTAQPDPTANAEVVRQQLALFEERFRKYLDDRLKTHDAARQYRVATPPPATSDATPSAPEPPRFSAAPWLKPAIVVAAAGIAVLVLFAQMIVGAFLYSGLSRRLHDAQVQVQNIERRLPPRTGEAQRQRGRDPGTATQTPLAAPRFDVEQIAGNNWRERLKWVMQNNPELLLPLSQELDNNPSISEKVRAEVKDLKARAATLDQTERLRLRLLLYEAAMAAEVSPPAQIVIGGDGRDITADMAKTVGSALGVKTDPSSKDDFMAEVILRKVAR